MVYPDSVSAFYAAVDKYAAAFEKARLAQETVDLDSDAFISAMKTVEESADDEGDALLSEWARSREVGPPPPTKEEADSLVVDWVESPDQEDDGVETAVSEWDLRADLWESFPALLSTTPATSSGFAAVPAWAWLVVGLGVAGGIAAVAAARRQGFDD